MKECLEKIFGQSVDGVQVVIDPPMVYRHLGVDKQGNPETGAVTRPGTIYTNLSCNQFWGSPASFILHEYFHVLRQWANGMTIFSYALTFLAKEEEAKAFGVANAPKLMECLQCGSKQ